MNRVDYKHARARGLAPWSPTAASQELVQQVQAVLVEYRDHLPLTARQVFYRLVGAHGYSKTEKAYKRLLGVLNRARRAGLVEWSAIRDDGVRRRAAAGYDDPKAFLQTVRRTAQFGYQRSLREGQDVKLEVWVEAAGMVPQVARVAGDFGADVYSSGGFDSVTAKHNAALRYVCEALPTVVLHVGDHDPSGVAVWSSAADDIETFCHDLGVPGVVTFERVVVTESQVDRYELPGAPPKRTDKRGDWRGETYQAEALSPPQLADELRAAMTRHTDMAVLEEVLDVSRHERSALVDALTKLARGWS